MVSWYTGHQLGVVSELWKNSLCLHFLNTKVATIIAIRRAAPPAIPPMIAGLSECEAVALTVASLVEVIVVLMELDSKLYDEFC